MPCCTDILLLLFKNKSDEESLLEGKTSKDANIHPLHPRLRQLHKPITKQTSLPTNFTFNVRPPSPDLIHTQQDDDDYTNGKPRLQSHEY